MLQCGMESRDGKLSRLGKILSFGFYASNSVFKLFNYVNNQLSYSSQLKLEQFGNGKNPDKRGSELL